MATNADPHAHHYADAHTEATHANHHADAHTEATHANHHADALLGIIAASGGG
jgi:hypothetical protein